MDDGARSLSADKIRENIADYRRSAESARQKAVDTALPQLRDSYLRMAEGFERLASGPTLQGAVEAEQEAVPITGYRRAWRLPDAQGS